MHVKASGFMSVTGCLKQMTEEHIIKFIFDVCFVIGEKDRWCGAKTKYTKQKYETHAADILSNER